jgi:hypothetical protein
MAQIRQIFMTNYSRENPKSPDFYDKFHVMNREAVLFFVAKVRHFAIKNNPK